MSLESARELARTHANNLAADIVNATTRLEHIRLTQLAAEAEALAAALETVEPMHGLLTPTHLP